MKPENQEEGFMAVKQAISQAGSKESLLVLPELVLEVYLMTCSKHSAWHSR